MSLKLSPFLSSNLQGFRSSNDWLTVNPSQILTDPSSYPQPFSYKFSIFFLSQLSSLSPIFFSLQLSSYLFHSFLHSLRQRFNDNDTLSLFLHPYNFCNDLLFFFPSPTFPSSILSFSLSYSLSLSLSYTFTPQNLAHEPMPGNVSYTEQGFQNPTPGARGMNQQQLLNMNVPSPASSLSSFGPNSPAGLPGQSLFSFNPSHIS